MGNACACCPQPIDDSPYEYTGVATHDNVATHDALAIAIEAPHAFCEYEMKGHMCDTVAGSAATLLHTFLPNSMSPFIGHTPRRDFDLNRTEGRLVDYRPKLSAWMDAQTRFGVVSAHSFTAGTNAWSSANPKANSSELVILRTLEKSPEEDALLKDLTTKGFVVTRIEGDRITNDVQLEARIKHAQFVWLLEFNESLSNSRLSALCKAIADSLLASSSSERKHNGSLPKLTVMSLSDGVVERVIESKDFWLVRIYLSPTDRHDLYAPIAGRIIDIQAQQGTWKRPIFKSWETKRGHLQVWIKAVDGTVFGFWVEVGEGYITDTVKLEHEIGDQLLQSQRIGEIVIGSLAEVQIPKRFQIAVRVRDVVQGGKTLLAM